MGLRYIQRPLDCTYQYTIDPRITFAAGLPVAIDNADPGRFGNGTTHPDEALCLGW
jgi:hypothetical protein